MKKIKYVGTIKELNEALKSKETIWLKSQQRFWKMINPIIDLKWKIPNIIHRAKYGWGYADTWSFDTYLSDLIIGGLTYLKHNLHGCPMDIAQKYPNNGKSMKKWKEILDQIILAFVLHNKQVETKLNDTQLKQKRRGFRLFAKYFGDFWD